MKPIILASTSPRRLELLSATGLPYTSVAPDFVEDNTLEMPPAELVKHLALGKAQSVARMHPDAIVIAADTLVVCGGQVLGKPVSEEDARRMIELLSGGWNSVVTGLAVVSGDRHTLDSVETKVHFTELGSHEISRYAQLKSIRDLAGAYAVQPGGAAALFIDRIEGDYLSTVGLPLNVLHARLQEFGVQLFDYTT